MVAKKGGALETLEIRALYTIATLARAADMPGYKLRRLLQASGVVLLTTGRTLYVPLSEIRRKLPPLWESIVDAERARHESAEPATDPSRHRPLRSR